MQQNVNSVLEWFVYFYWKFLAPIATEILFELFQRKKIAVKSGKQLLNKK